MLESSPLIAILIVVCVAYKIIKAFFKSLSPDEVERRRIRAKMERERMQNEHKKLVEEYKKSCEELKKCFTKRFWTDPNYF
ncbi:MAG: hypothetical protein ACI37N_03345 [Prevotella sp.]